MSPAKEEKRMESGYNAAALWKWGVATVVALWGGLSATVHLLLIMMAFDFVTGIAVAIIERKVASSESFRGMVRKTLTLVMVAVCHFATKPMGLSFDLGEVVAVAYTVNEIISIVENCARAGVPIPPVVLESLSKFKRLRRANNNANGVAAGGDGNASTSTVPPPSFRG